VFASYKLGSDRTVDHLLSLHALVGLLHARARLSNSRLCWAQNYVEVCVMLSTLIRHEEGRGCCNEYSINRKTIVSTADESLWKQLTGLGGWLGMSTLSPWNIWRSHGLVGWLSQLLMSEMKMQER